MIRVEIVEAARTTDLRRTVLRPQWPASRQMFGDDQDDVVHLAALDDAAGPSAQVVGACVLLAAPYPHRNEPDAWQLRAMATDATYRSQGVGALVLATAGDTVTSRGGRFLWCRARSAALRFYERNGFVVDTEEYVEPNTGLPHHDMYRRLSPA